MKTTTKIAVIITSVIAIVVIFTAIICVMKLPTRVDDELVQEIYTEGFEVSSLTLNHDYSGILRYYVGLRNDNNAVVVEIDEELFASLTVGDIVIAEVLEKNGNGVKILVLSNIEIYNE